MQRMILRHGAKPLSLLAAGSGLSEFVLMSDH